MGEDGRRRVEGREKNETRARRREKGNEEEGMDVS